MDVGHRETVDQAVMSIFLTASKTPIIVRNDAGPHRDNPILRSRCQCYSSYPLLETDDTHRASHYYVLGDGFEARARLPFLGTEKDGTTTWSTGAFGQ